MSIVMDDCIARGLDYHNGGARYNPTYIQGVGIGTLTDSLAAVKYHVFDEQNISMDELLKAMQADFEGYEHLRRKLLYNTPKYGNDDDYADEIAEEVFNVYYDLLNGRPNTKGGRYRVNLLPTTVHIYFLALWWAPFRTAEKPARRSPKAFRRPRAPIRKGRPLLSSLRPESIMHAPAGRCSYFVQSSKYRTLDGDHIARIGPCDLQQIPRS